MADKMENKKNQLVSCSLLLYFYLQQILCCLLLFFILFLPVRSSANLFDKLYILNNPLAILNNGDLYRGPLNNRNGLPDGNGHLQKLGTGASYKGHFSNGYLEGPVTIRYTHGDKFEGTFVQGRAYGKGIYTGVDGRKISGFFNASDACPEFAFISVTTKNTEEQVDNSRHEPEQSSGYFKCTRCTGKGVIVWPDHRVYFGEILQGKMHGHGVLNWSNGFTYEGAFFNDSLQGEGKLFYRFPKTSNNIIFKGKWEHNYFILVPEGLPDKYRSKTDGILLTEPFALTRDENPQYAEWQYIKQRSQYNPFFVNPITHQTLTYSQVEQQGVDYQYQQEIKQWLNENAIQIFDVIQSKTVITSISQMYAVSVTNSVSDESACTATITNTKRYSILLDNEKREKQRVYQYTDQDS